MDPNFSFGHARLSELYSDLGKYEEAIAELQKAGTLDGMNPQELSAWTTSLRRSLAKAGATGYWQRLSVGDHKPYKGFVFLAGAYSRLGRKEEAVKALEDGFQHRDPEMLFIAVDPALYPLHSEPGYIALLHSMGLNQ